MGQSNAPNDFAARVRKLRGAMTQTQFAKRIGVSFVTVNRWENNHHKPTPLAWQLLLKLEEKQARKEAKQFIITRGHHHGRRPI